MKTIIFSNNDMYRNAMIYVTIYHSLYIILVGFFMQVHNFFIHSINYDKKFLSLNSTRKEFGAENNSEVVNKFRNYEI